VACGSPRLLRHPELDRLAIAHVDCDAFFAAVEKRDDPALADRPVIVGGGKRGVVMTACYIARINGVRSAMPMFKALQACPQAVVVRPNMAKYAQAGREVRRLMGHLTPLVEPVSIDEAFLDLSGTDRVHRASPAASLVRLAATVESEVGISISVGLSFNKFLAKLASDQDKPRGFAVIGRGDLPHCLDERPVGTLPGIGPRARARLEKGGIVLVRHLRERPLESFKPCSAATSSVWSVSRVATTVVPFPWPERRKGFRPRRPFRPTSRAPTNSSRSCGAWPRRCRDG
jgi:DNA polymerase-4